RDFPDMVVAMDKLEPESPDGGGSSYVSPARTDAVFHWTLTGTNTGPGGTGKRVRISGYELWKLDPDGLIAESKGHFDSVEYERQLKPGVGDQRMNPDVGL